MPSFFAKLGATCRISSGSLDFQPVSLDRVDVYFQRKAILPILGLWHAYFMSLFPCRGVSYKLRTIKPRAKKKENERKKESAMRHLITFRSGILSILTPFRFFYPNFQILCRNTPVLRLPLKGKPSVLDQTERKSMALCS